MTRGGPKPIDEVLVEFARRGAAAQEAVDELGAGRRARARKLADTLRAIASSARFDALAFDERKELRLALYELADQMEDL